MISKFYCKDDLPTWHEVYYDFYLNNLFFYDQEKDTDIDFYWREPKKKILIGFMCNQLNKMIFEDNTISLDFVKEVFNNDKIINFYFVLSNDIEVCTDSPPSVYALKIPSTGKFSIFSTPYKRKDLGLIERNIEMKLILVENSYDFSIIDYKDPNFRKVLIKIIEIIIDYFRDPIGWK